MTNKDSRRQHHCMRRNMSAFCRSCVLLLLLSLSLPLSICGSIDDWFTKRCPAAETEQPVQLAFCIMTHSNIELTARLLHSIYSRKHVYALLPDLNSGADFHRQVQHLVTPAMSWQGNVYVLEPRAVLRFGISMVDAELHCMQHLLRATDFDYFINLSESHYPLHSMLQLARGLRGCASAQLNFLELYKNHLPVSELATSNKEDKTGMLLRRHAQLHIDTGLRERGIVRMGETPVVRPFFQGGEKLVIRRASQWMIAHRSLCEYALSSHGRSLLLFFSTKSTSDAHYFPTLALNSARFNNTIIPNGLHRHYWDCHAPKGHACVIKNWHKVKSAAESTNPPYFFIRKFDVNASRAFTPRIDAEYLNTARSCNPV